MSSPPRTDSTVKSGSHASDWPRPGEAVPAPGSAQSPPSPTGQAKQRDPFFDNAKYLAIVLVACGHAWEPLTHNSRTAHALYLVVYTFHMPAFVVVSGYFSRSFDSRPDRMKRLVTGVVVPYVLFETAYSLFYRWGADPGHPISLMNPWYLCWFLAALFIWRLTAPIWRIVRWPVPVALAIAVLAATSKIGNDLDLSRVLQFLPFFVLGLCMKPEHFRLMRRREMRLLSLPVTACALVMGYWLAPTLDSGWFYRTESAQEMGFPWWMGVVMTVALFGCSVLLTASFFAWVPGRDMWFTALGAGTLYGYLLHGFLAKASRWWHWYDAADWVRTPGGAVAVTVIAAAAVTVLCTAPVRRMFRWAMEPDMDWAFRKAPKQEKLAKQEKREQPELSPGRR